MSRLPRPVWLLLVVLACVGVDQVTKAIAKDTLRGEPPISLLDGVVRLIYAENPGVAISLGANLPPLARFWLLTVGVAIVLVVLTVYLLKREPAGRMFLWGGALVLGGGFSNLLDRLYNDGRVIDFLLLTAGPLRTAIFNLADMLIVTGVILLLFAGYREPEPGQKESETDR